MRADLRRQNEQPPSRKFRNVLNMPAVALPVPRKRKKNTKITSLNVSECQHGRYFKNIILGATCHLELCCRTNVSWSSRKHRTNFSESEDRGMQIVYNLIILTRASEKETHRSTDASNFGVTRASCFWDRNKNRSQDTAVTLSLLNAGVGWWNRPNSCARSDGRWAGKCHHSGNIGTISNNDVS